MRGRRRASRSNTGFIYAILMLVGLSVLLSGLSRISDSAISLFIMLAIALGSLAFWVRKSRMTYQNYSQAVSEITERHLRALVTRRSQLVRHDPYGKPIIEKWYAEINYFISNHLEPLLNAQQQKILHRERNQVFVSIARRVESEIEVNPTHLRFSEGIDAQQFEVFCAEELQRAGWDAQVTSQSRDQGADVVAEKEGIRIVLQCKLYKRPVGNKAVQEVVAARAHQRADFGAVVTNSSYTSAATELAATNDVLLLHYLDLSNLAEMLTSA